MKNMLFALLAMFALPQLIQAAGDQEPAAAPEKTLLVKITDHAEKVTYELKSPAEFQQLLKQIATEAKFHVKALEAAEKTWKEEEDTKKKAFPRGAIAVRKAVSIKEFIDATKASDALSAEEGKEADKAKAEKEKQAAKDKAAIDKKLKTQVQIDKDKRKDEEKESLFNSARSLYETKLEELMTPPAEGGGEAKEADKKDAKKDAAKEEPKHSEKKTK